MIRNLKSSGLALVAVLATGLLAASSASATDLFTTANEEPALVTGVSHDKVLSFTSPPWTIQCTTAKLAGTITHGSSEMTADLSYTGTLNVVPHTNSCGSSLGHTTVGMNGCHFKLTGSTTGDDPPVAGKDATTWIECPTKPIEIAAPAVGLAITIPSQTPTGGGVTYTNVPNHEGASAIKIATTATGITYSCHPTFVCTVRGIAHHNNDLDLTGTMTLTGYEDKDGLPTPVTEGARVGVSFHTS